MDPLSSVASVIAVIQLAESIVKICGGYIQEVKDARDEILELQQAVTAITGVLQELKVLLQDPKGAKLSSSRTLDGPIAMCCSTLTALEVTIDTGMGKKAMRKLGFRAWKWPLKRPEVDRIISDLERYKSTFTLSLQIDQTTVITGINETTDRIDRNLNLKQLPVARGAEFDSYTNQYNDYCLPGTRKELLGQVMEWASSQHGKCIFWLNGRAGTGKSTVSRTVSEALKRANSLGATFFFKRGEGDRGNAMKLFPTIVRQLAKSIPQLIPGVQKAIHDNTDIATKGLKEQFDKILLQPLLDLDPSALPTRIAVIVIDALDECDMDNNMRIILRLLPRLQHSKSVRLRVFLTSRPEWPIFQEFSKITSREYEDLILHQIPEPVIEHDISLFLKHRLQAIRTDRSLPVDWPRDVDIQKLVALSVPLFIFAATICRVFEDPRWDPMDSLQEILSHRNDASKLDRTYLPIINRLLDRQNEKQKEQLVQEFQKVVGAIVILESPLSVISLSRLIGLPEGVVHLRLNPLHSILNIPDDETLPVRLFHLSFRDFLLDPETREKTPFWVDKKEIHSTLATRCLIVCEDLRKNICGLPSDGTKRAQIDQQTIDHCLSPELQYSCQYWAYHLAQCTDSNAVMYNALLFLQRHFLHWVETMSLLGLILEVVGILNLLQAVIPGDHHPAISEFLHDAKRFVLKNLQIADEAPLQLYSSGLVFAPRTATIRRYFKNDLPSLIRRLPQVEERWSAELQALESHSGSVNSVAFSPDGRLLASGSNDETVRLWDTATGALQQAVEGHSSSVNSVVFSPDGRLLASGSNDETVRLWDTVTGALQQTLNGHLSSVNSVVFSLDGRLLASGSNDETIRLWDTATGALQQILEGYVGWVRSVAFSPDGRLLASGSDDETVRLWDTATGALQQTLEGHSNSVNSVVFSPDSRLLASGSGDDIVRLWDTATGALRQTFEGHSGWVISVAFSPNGCLLASGSRDKTTRLWDTATGALRQTLEGHSGSVRSVAFSPNGRLLASSSNDKTVRLWDTAIGGLQQILESHSDWVTSVALSPNGQLLASGSRDKTARLWDTATGALQQTLEGHSDTVRSVAFSPNGRLLASGSNDKTVRIWDTATGALQQTLEGHLGWVTSVVFSPNGRLLASGSRDKTARLWDTATGALQQTLKGHSDSVRSVAFSPNGRLLASGSSDKTVRLWILATGGLQHILEGHSNWVISVAFSPNGRLLASGSSDKSVRFWDPATGALQQILEGHSDWVISVAFSADGRLLASGSRDKTSRLWDTATGALQQTLEGHSDTVRSVAFSTNGWLLASGSHDNTVRLWDLATGALQQTLEGHSGWVISVAFSPNGQLLASSSSDKTVRFWDPATGALQQSLEGHLGWVTSVAFSPNGQLLASGSRDKTTRLWDTATGALQQTLEGHSDTVRSVAFSPNGRLLASGSNDKTVRIWDTATGALQQTLEGHSGWVTSVAFSPDSRLLASGSRDKTARLWDTTVGALRQTWAVEGAVTNLQFHIDGSRLITNLSALGIQSRCNSRTSDSSDSPHGNLEISIEHGQWIKLNGENVLWLPAEFRPRCSATNDGVLALGHASGRVSFIGFHVY